MHTTKLSVVESFGYRVIPMQYRGITAEGDAAPVPLAKSVALFLFFALKNSILVSLLPPASGISDNPIDTNH